MVDKRKREARARARATGESYPRALRQVSTDTTGHRFMPGSYDPNRWDRCAKHGCWQDWNAPVHRIGGLTPPKGWPTGGRHPAMLSTFGR